MASRSGSRYPTSGERIRAPAYTGGVGFKTTVTFFSEGAAAKLSINVGATFGSDAAAGAETGAGEVLSAWRKAPSTSCAQ